MPLDGVSMGRRSLPDKRSKSIMASMKRAKVRFAMVVHTTGDGTKQGFAEAMTASGMIIHPTTIATWMDPNEAGSPNVDDLIAIHKIRPTISIDWLLGLRQAESLDEKWIESQETVRSAYARIAAEFGKAAKVLAILAFLGGAVACVAAQSDKAEHFAAWLKVCDVAHRALSVEDWEQTRVAELVAAGRIGRPWKNGMTHRWSRKPSLSLLLRGKWK